MVSIFSLFAAWGLILENAHQEKISISRVPVCVATLYAKAVPSFGNENKDNNNIKM